MKFPRQVWTYDSDKRVLVTGTSPVPQELGIKGQMVEFACLASNSEPRDFDCAVRFRGQDVYVDCLNIAAASCKSFGEMLGKLDENSFTAVQQKITEIDAELESEQRSRERDSASIQFKVWKEHPKLAETMRVLNAQWNTDFTFVVFDSRSSIDSRDGIERRLCISFGHNHTSPEKRFLAPPYQPGPVVLAMHEFVVRGGTETLAVDCWMDAFPIAPTTDLSTIEAAAKQVLASIDDETYFRMMEGGNAGERKYDQLTDLYGFTFSDEG